MSLDRFAIAGALRELGMLLSLKGENRFKARAYVRGAEALEQLQDDFGALVRQNRITEVEGIGASLASVIRELWNTGRSMQLEKLRAEIPRGIIELSKLDLGEQRRKALHEGLRIDSIEALEAALETGAVRGIKGFGPKTEARIKEAVTRYREGAEWIQLLDARETAERLTRYLAGDPNAERIEIGGPLRRWHEAVERIELVVESKDPARTAERFVDAPEAIRTETLEMGRASIRLATGARAELWAIPSRRFAAALVLSTGSKEHVLKLEARAKARGMSLADLASKTEEELYRTLGLSFIPPELREDAGEIEAAAERDLTADLVDVPDIRGMVHCHTTYSDGRASIEEMALAADRLGIEYLTITDHSPTAHYAGGVTIDRLKAQWDEIAEVQERVKVRLLRGTESDILADGALDYPDPILEQLDIVIASIHTRHKLDEDAMTARVVRAMKHPAFKIWGHALGRLVLKRDPIRCRVEEVLDVIAQQRAAIEISGDPNRLELEPKWVRAARERGIKFVVSVDAHSTRALEYLPLGVHLARRGGARKDEVLNTLPFERFKAAVRPAGAI